MTATERTAVYRLFDATDALLYVGMSDIPRQRWWEHAAEKSWWRDVVTREIEWYPSRPAARAAELTAIQTEGPKYNIADVPRPRAGDADWLGARSSHELVAQFQDDIEAVIAIADPAERARVLTESLAIFTDANGTLAKRRRDDVRELHAAGESYRKIGGLIGVHHTRVKQIHDEMPSGSSARNRAERAARAAAAPADDEPA